MFHIDSIYQIYDKEDILVEMLYSSEVGLFFLGRGRCCVVKQRNKMPVCVLMSSEASLFEGTIPRQRSTIK